MKAAARVICIVGSDSRVVLPVARSLRRQGLSCVLVVPPGESFSKPSRAISHVVPLHGTIDEAASLLALIAEAERPHWVAAASDSGLAILSAARDRLLGSCPVGSPSQHVVKRVLDRAATVALLDAAGLTAPVRTASLPQPDSADAATCVSLLVSDGTIRACFQHSVTRSNAMSWRCHAESQAVDTALVARAKSIMDALDWDGVAMIEFRRTSANEVLSFHRFTGRFWDPVAIAIDSGVDFPRYAWEAARGIRTFVPVSYRVGVRTAVTSACLDAIPMPTNSVPLGESNVADASTDLPRRRNTPPGAGTLAMVQNLASATGLADLRRFWSRRLGLETQQMLPPGIRSVLFVCQGNIIRSAAAAQFLRDALDAAGVANVKVTSAGTSARTGMPADERADQAARKLGSSLQHHRSYPVNDFLVESADVILAMDDQNLANLRTRYPAARSKILLLGGLDPSGHWQPTEIADPYSGTQADVTRAIRQIHEAVTALVRAMQVESTSRASTP